MVGSIIRRYIERGGKKLTIPAFGTFMRKDTGEIIFVDLLRTDDGVLAELVEDYGHYSEVEAMALIDRFIFEVRNDIEQRGSHDIEGFGVMTRDAKGLYQFDHSHSARPVRERAVQENLFGSVGSTTTVAGQGIEAQKPVSHNVTVAKKPKRRFDLVIIIAVVAAIIAALVLYFGFSTGNMPFLKS